MICKTYYGPAGELSDEDPRTCVQREQARVRYRLELGASPDVRATHPYFQRGAPVTQRQLIGRTVTVLAVIVLAGILIWFVRAVTNVLMVLLVSAILSAGLAPIVGWVQRCRIMRLRPSRGVAIFVVYFTVFITVAIALTLIIVPAVGEAKKFVQQGPQLFAGIRHWLVAVRLQRPWLPDLASSLDHLGTQASNVTGLGSGAALVALRVVGGATAAIMVLVITFYMLLEGAAIKRAFLALAPREERPRVDLMLHRIGLHFGGWLRGQLLIALAVAVPVSLALLLIGIPYPFLIGVVAGLGEFIPMVGLMLGAAVATLVALGQPIWQLLAVVIFFVVAMNLESHILIPRLMSRVLGLSPLLTIIALFVGVTLMGVLGGLVALPVAAALQVIVREIVLAVESGSPISPLAPATTELPPSGRSDWFAPAEEGERSGSRNRPGQPIEVFPPKHLDAPQFKAGTKSIFSVDGVPAMIDEDTVVWAA
jgi:predicted PurR-regulated permease PerM